MNNGYVVNIWLGNDENLYAQTFTQTLEEAIIIKEAQMCVFTNAKLSPTTEIVEHNHYEIVRK